jgi:hypothetical protein
MRVSATLSAAAAAVLLGAAPASAQVDSYLFSPVIDGQFVAPSYFEGLYVGALFGSAGADHGNFYPTGGIDRGGGGAALGWNTYLAPGVVAGGEVQGYIDTDYMGAWSVSAVALARLGLTTADDFLVYGVAGGGLFDLVPAYAFGAGVEWGVWNAASVRGEILTFSQAVPANGKFIPGVTAWMIRLGALWHFGQGAQDIPGLHLSLDRPASITDFGGLYYGASYGIDVNGTWNFFPDTGYGLHMTRGDIGAFAGYNFRLLNGVVVAGVEGQASFLYDTSGDVAGSAFGLARAGIVPLEGLMVYGAGGVGILQAKPAYAAGGGIEYALWGDSSVRLEGLAFGELSSTPTVAGFSAYKIALGAVWHPE